MLPGFKFKRHEKEHHACANMQTKHNVSKWHFNQRPKFIVLHRLHLFNVCRPHGFIKRQAFMIAFINGMFCQSLQCEFFNNDRDSEPHTTPKECWGVTTLAPQEMLRILGKQPAIKIKVGSSHNGWSYGPIVP